MLIMAAPNGARRGKADHPGIPISIAETVSVTKACVAAGANALHLHIRDTTGQHSLDPGLYREALADVAAALPDLPVQVTTEAADLFDMEAQFALLTTLRPKWTTIALRELATDLALARRVYAACAEQGTEVQHIVFDATDAELLAGWQREGVIGEDASVILVLGRYTADMNSDPTTLGPLLAALPTVGTWMLCAFGPNEHACLLEAARRGGDLRVGFENSFLQSDGMPWRDMAASVAALVAAIGQ